MKITALCLFATLVAPAAQSADDGWEARLTDIDDYVLEDHYEVALAESAAPDSVSSDATVLVMRRGGYQEVRRGDNGFTCLVERSWSSPFGPHDDFFNPELRAPICYNEEASRTVLGDYLRRTELAIAGRSIAEIRQTIESEIGTGKLTAPRGLAMSFMMSSGQKLSSRNGRFKPHVMFYVPYASDDALGNTAHAVIFEHGGGPLAAIVVPVTDWIEVEADASANDP